MKLPTPLHSPRNMSRAYFHYNLEYNFSNKRLHTDSKYDSFDIFSFNQNTELILAT